MADEHHAPMRRGLDELDEATASAEYLEARKRARSSRVPITVGLVLLLATCLGFIAWRWVQGQRHPSRVEDGSRAVGGLATE